MAKLYQILGEKLGFFHHPASKVEFFNPLGAALQCPLSIDYLDCRGKDWFVEDVQQYETDLGGNRYFLADYLLASKDLHGTEDRIKLRIVAGPKAMLLRKSDEMEYDAGFERDVLNDPSLLFNIDYQDDKGQNVHEEYTRCGGARLAYQAAVKTLRGETFDLKYWDYSRAAESDGVQTEQYVYVEMLSANGYVTIWHGEEISPECVEVFTQGKSDAHAQLDQMLAAGLDAIAKAKADLEAEKELVISSQRRVDQDTAEADRLTNRIKAALSDGDPQGASKEYALSLARVREQLASNSEQLARHKANYEAFAQKVEIGQRQVLEAKQKARDLGLAAQESEREAKLSRFAEDIGGETADRMRGAMSKLQETIDVNKAKTAVSDDLNQPSLAEAKEHAAAEQAKAAAILAEFAKK